MLDALRNLLADNELLIEKELSEISFCKDLHHKILWFENICISFQQSIGVGNRLKVVDGAYLSDIQDTLYLIEWTKYSLFSQKGNTIQQFIEKQFQFELLNKAVDSIFLLLGIVGYYNINKDFYAYFLDAHHHKTLKVKVLLLTDMDDMDLLTLDQLTLGQQSIGLTSRVGNPIYITNCSSVSQYLPQS